MESPVKRRNWTWSLDTQGKSPHQDRPREQPRDTLWDLGDICHAKIENHSLAIVPKAKSFHRFLLCISIFARTHVMQPSTFPERQIVKKNGNWKMLKPLLMLSNMVRFFSIGLFLLHESIPHSRPRRITSTWRNRKPSVPPPTEMTLISHGCVIAVHIASTNHLFHNRHNFVEMSRNSCHNMRTNVQKLKKGNETRPMKNTPPDLSELKSHCLPRFFEKIVTYAGGYH